MSTDRDMPESWRRNDRRRQSGVTAAIVRAREATAGATEPGPRPVTVDELAERRRERRAAEEARRRLLPPDPPPGPRTA